MRRLWAATAVILFALYPTDIEAAARGFTGTLAIAIGTLSPIVVPGAGTAIVNGSSGGGHLTALTLPAGAFASTYVLPVTDPAAAPIRGVQVTLANGAGSLSGFGGSGSFGGTMALAGFAKVCLFGPCSTALSNLSVPLGVVGAGGFAAITAAVNLTVIGAPWTTGTASFGTITAMGGASPASSTNTVTLVTPFYISTGIAASVTIPAFAYLTIGGLAIPEPGTLVLLGSGVVGLVAYARRRAGAASDEARVRVE